MAIAPLIPDEIIQLKSPNPVTEIGPRTITKIPPPSKINPHIANKNPNNLFIK